jgi:hypothetical protein
MPPPQRAAIQSLKKGGFNLKNDQIEPGAQALLNVSYDVAGCFEEYLSDEYKTFLHMLRVIEEQMPILIRPYAGTRRIPYQYTPFIRSFFAKGYFGKDTNCILM